MLSFVRAYREACSRKLPPTCELDEDREAKEAGA